MDYHQPQMALSGGEAPYETERRAINQAEMAVIARIKSAVFKDPDINFDSFHQSLIQPSKDLLAFVAKNANAANSEEYFKYIAEEVRPRSRF